MSSTIFSPLFSVKAILRAASPGEKFLEALAVLIAGSIRPHPHLRMVFFKYHLMALLLALTLLALVHTSTSADACNAHRSCDKCNEARGCNWCWDGANVGCQRVIDPVQCCTRCDECDEKIRFKALSLGLMVSLLIGSVAILIVSIGYSYYRYYWTKRHFFEVLE